MEFPLEKVRIAATAVQNQLVDFTRRIVAVPSLSGQESEVVALITQEMSDLGYDQVYTDELGNVIGKIEGGDGPTVMLNGHCDHVDPGPLEGWPYPPFSAEIVDGELWGRASVDMKGSVACMVYATALFKKLDRRPSGDILMTVPVMEEVGGVGTQYLVKHLQAQSAICGEPSNNTLRRGHRGRVELKVTFEGKSAHASVPHLGFNPHFVAARFIQALSQLKMGQDELGVSTVVPTVYTTDQTSCNVIPSRVDLVLDWRNVPSETPAEVLLKTEALLADCLAAGETPPGVSVEIVNKDHVSYTGLKQTIPMVFPSFLLPEESSIVQTAKQWLSAALGNAADIDVWRFATDGGHLMTAGIPTIGFGPGDEKLAHTNQERISLQQMQEAVVGYVALIEALSTISD